VTIWQSPWPKRFSTWNILSYIFNVSMSFMVEIALMPRGVKPVYCRRVWYMRSRMSHAATVVGSTRLCLSSTGSMSSKSTQP